MMTNTAREEMLGKVRAALQRTARFKCGRDSGDGADRAARSGRCRRGISVVLFRS